MSQTTRESTSSVAASPVTVVAVTRREYSSRGARTVQLRREPLTSASALPDRESRADVVVVAYHAGLSAPERSAITGPARRSAVLDRVLVASGVAFALVVVVLLAALAGWIPVWPVVAALGLAAVTLVALVPVGILDVRRVWTDVVGRPSSRRTSGPSPRT